MGSAESSSASLARMEAEVKQQHTDSAPPMPEPLPVSASEEDTAVVPKPHRDWLNWRPADSAAEDNKMVQNVLGTVAQLRGGQGVPAQVAVSNAEPTPSRPAPQVDAAPSGPDGTAMTAL